MFLSVLSILIKSSHFLMFLVYMHLFYYAVYYIAIDTPGCNILQARLFSHPIYKSKNSAWLHIADKLQFIL